MNRYIVSLGLSISLCMVVVSGENNEVSIKDKIIFSKTIKFNDSNLLNNLIIIKSGSDNDEVRNEFDRLSKEENIIAFNIIDKVEKEGKTRGKIVKEIVDSNKKSVEGNLQINKNKKHIIIYLDASKLSRPIYVVYRDKSIKLAKTDKKILLKMDISKIQKGDKIVLKDRKGNIIIEKPINIE